MRALAAFVAALSAFALLTKTFGVGAPVKAAGFVITAGVAVWRYRADVGGDRLPVLGEIIIVLLSATTVGFAYAWFDERRSPADDYDFVVAPKGFGALESIAPAPHTESEQTGILPRGAHLTVTCYVRGRDKHVWYRLADHNFMSDRDLVPAPLGPGRPPEC